MMKKKTNKLIKNTFISCVVLASMTNGCPAYGSEKSTTLKPKDFEQLLTRKDRDYYWQYSDDQLDSNGCVIRRSAIFSPKTYALPDGAPRHFIEALKVYDEEYRQAKHTTSTIIFARTSSILWNKRKNNQQFSVEEQAWIEKNYRYINLKHVDYYEDEEKCLHLLKPYSNSLEKLLLKGAKQEYIPSILALSVVYEYGIGTDIDLIKAYAWRGVSVALNRPFGQNKLDILAKRLDPFELNKAEDLSFQYQKNHTKLFDSPTGVIWNK